MPVVAWWFFGIHRGCKKKWQPVADTAGSYGAGILSDSDRGNHECYFGLYLNQHRQRTRFALSVTQGVGLALSAEWSEDVFSAIANNDEEANYLHQMHKANAAMAAQSSRSGQA